ncbi:hypothetical protein ID866_2608 [Astraeus odoratus]|nr:hypothetical protein ID866_2608 [Astraeus odoratus]
MSLFLAPSQPSANPDEPPPAYSVRVPQPGSPSSPHSPQASIPGHYPYRTSFAPHPHFGPTPLMQSQPTLGVVPYYDPHSPHSLQAAVSRARRRFVSAMAWAVGIILFLCAVGALGAGSRD